MNKPKNKKPLRGSRKTKFFRSSDKQTDAKEKSSDKLVRKTITIEKQLLQKLKAYALLQNISVTQAIDDMFEDFLESANKKASIFEKISQIKPSFEKAVRCNIMIKKNCWQTVKALAILHNMHLSNFINHIFQEFLLSMDWGTLWKKG